MAKDLVFTILGIDKASPAFAKVSRAADEAGDSLDRASKVGVKAMAALPLAATASGVAVAGSMALLAAGVVGMSALVLASNKQVNDSFSQLGIESRQAVEDAAAPMADDFVLAANKMRGAVQDMRPQLIELFSAAQPSVDHFAEGIAGLATNVLPGFVTAVKRSEPAMAGFESFLKSTGTGVSEFFTNVSAGAESSGQIMVSTGHIVRDFGGFTGALFAQLSNSGSPAVRALEATLRQLEGTVLSLGGSAFPGLATAASGFLTAGTGMLRLLQLIAPVIGPLIPMAANFAATLKLVDMVSFGGVSAGLGMVKTAISEADGVGGKLKAGFGALASGPLPILGIAAVGLSLILDNLGKKQREAAEAAQYHDSIVRKLSGTLDKTTGAITENTRETIANQVAKENVGKANTTLAVQASRLGISTQNVTAAVLDSDGALRRMDTSLRGTVERQIRSTATQKDLDFIYQKTGKTVDDLVTVYMGGAGGVDEFHDALVKAGGSVRGGSAQMEGLSGRLQAATLESRNLWGGITQLNTGLTDAQKQALQAAAAMGAMTPAQLEAKAKSDALQRSIAVLGDAFKSTAEKGQAVVDVLDRMSGKEPDLREAIQAWNDLMRSMTKDTDWNSTVDGIQKLSGSLVDMKGEVNTTTEAGSKLQDWARQSQVDFANTGAAMKAAGMPADEMSAKLGVMRQQFIDNAVAQGLPRDAAIRLADAYHLVPGEVVTAMYAPGLIERMTELGMLQSKIERLPDGRFTVTANTDPASGMIQKLVTDYQGKVIRLTVTASGVVSNLSGGGMKFMSKGGWVDGPGTTTSDSVPTMLSRREFVVPADQADENAPILEAILAGRDPISATAGPLARKRAIASSMPSPSASPTIVNKHYHLTVYNARNTVADLREQFRQLELMA